MSLMEGTVRLGGNMAVKKGQSCGRKLTLRAGAWTLAYPCTRSWVGATTLRKKSKPCLGSRVCGLLPSCLRFVSSISFPTLFIRVYVWKVASGGEVRKNPGDWCPARELPSSLDSILQKENCIILIKRSRTALLCQTKTGSNLLESPGPLFAFQTVSSSNPANKDRAQAPGAPKSWVLLPLLSCPPLEVDKTWLGVACDTPAFLLTPWGSPWNPPQ